LWIGFAYTNGNGDSCGIGNCNGYCNGYGDCDSDTNAYCIANATEYGHTTAASYTASPAVKALGLHAAFFGNSRSNSRVPEKPWNPSL